VKSRLNLLVDFLPPLFSPKVNKKSESELLLEGMESGALV
jgi:hypothetical protein